MIELIYGRAGSGKSRYVIDKIALIARNDPLKKVIVACPEQYTLQMERDIIYGSGLSGLMGVEVLSFSRLTRRILDDAGLNAEPLSPQVIAMQLSFLLKQGKFSGFEDKPGVEAALANTITELKRYDISPGELISAASLVSGGGLAQKLRDLGEACEKLMRMNEGRPDAIDLLNQAIELIPDTGFLKGCELVVDGFDMVTAQIKRMLYALLLVCRNAFITFRCGEPSDPDAYIFEGESALSADIARFADSRGIKVKTVALPRGKYGARHNSPELEHLSKNLFAYPYEKYGQKARGVVICPGKSATDEARRCASEIFALTRKNMRYRDIAVIAPTSYLPIVKSVFDACAIPCFADTKKSADGCALFTFLDSALGLAAGRWNEEETARYLKSGLLPVSQEEAASLLAYMREYGVKAYALKAPLKFTPDKYPLAEDIRFRALGPLSSLNFKEGAAKGVDSVLNMLESTLALETMRRRISEMEERGFMDAALYNGQAVDAVLGSLKDIADVFGDQPLSAAGLKRLLASACGAVKIAVIPPINDAVALGEMGRSRFAGIEALFLLGANEGAYDEPEPPGVIYESERADLEGAGLVFNRPFKRADEKLRVYEALCKPKSRLYISYLAGAREWTAVSRIRNIFGLKNGLFGGNEAPGNLLMHSFFSELISALEGGEANVEFIKNAYATLLADRTFSKVVGRALKALDFDYADEPLPSGLARALYGGARGSVSRIERFSECPFKYFMSYGMRAAPAPEAYDNAADFGSVMHSAMDGVAKALGARIGEADEDEVTRLASNAADEAFEKQGGGRFTQLARKGFYKKLITGQAALCALVVHEQLKGTKARVLGSEIEFGGENGPSYEIKLGQGAVARLTGLIDRADTLVINGREYVRVVDYKLSGSRLDATDLYYGVNIQLITYLMAVTDYLKAVGKNAYPFGAYYFDLSVPFSEDGQFFDAKRMRGVTLNDAGIAREFCGEEDGRLRAVYMKIGKDGSLKGEPALCEEDFRGLFEYVRRLIGDRLKRIAAGETAVAPYASAKRKACDYCDFKCACMYGDEYARGVTVSARDYADILEEVK